MGGGPLMVPRGGPVARRAVAFRLAARGRLLFGAAFLLLLLDGGAAIWLWQLSGARWLLLVGIALVAAALGVLVAFRRWQDAVAALEATRRELRAEVEALRRAVGDAESGPPRPGGDE